MLLDKICLIILISLTPVLYRATFCLKFKVVCVGGKSIQTMNNGGPKIYLHATYVHIFESAFCLSTHLLKFHSILVSYDRLKLRVFRYTWLIHNGLYVLILIVCISCDSFTHLGLWGNKMRRNDSRKIMDDLIGCALSESLMEESRVSGKSVHIWEE